MPAILADTSFLALTDGQVVALDLRTNRYCLIESRDPEALLQALATTGPAPAVVMPDIQALVEGGLAAKPGAAAKLAVPLGPHPTARELPGCRIDAIPRVSPRDIASTAHAAAWAAALLRFRRLEAITRIVARLRIRFAGRPRADDRAIVDLYERHLRARSLFYDGNDMCLRNALTLLRLLATAGVFPHWHFGVQLNPFAAHCWLEDERFVYGESFSYCRDFALIMKV